MDDIHKELTSGVTVGDVESLSNNGISTLELDFYDENFKRYFKYSAVCKSKKDIRAVEKLNNAIASRPSYEC